MGKRTEALCRKAVDWAWLSRTGLAPRCEHIKHTELKVKRTPPVPRICPSNVYIVTRFQVYNHNTWRHDPETSTCNVYIFVVHNGCTPGCCTQKFSGIYLQNGVRPAVRCGGVRSRMQKWNLSYPEARPHLHVVRPLPQTRVWRSSQGSKTVTYSLGKRLPVLPNSWDWVLVV
jgi:hypothetical protein